MLAGEISQLSLEVTPSPSLAICDIFICCLLKCTYLWCNSCLVNVKNRCYEVSLLYLDVTQLTLLLVQKIKSNSNVHVLL